MTYQLDNALPLTDLGEGRWQSKASPDYSVGFGPYGGWIGALLMKAILAQKPNGEPLSISISFLGTCKPDLTGSTRLLRRSRSNEHWVAEFGDGEVLAAHAAVSFGVRRPTVTLGDLDPPAPAPEPETLPMREGHEGAPSFFHRYDMRPFVGQPGLVNTHSRTRAWIRDIDRRPLDFMSLVAIADSPVPRIFLRTLGPSPIATMSMTVYFHEDPASMAQEKHDFLLMDTECRWGREGFYDQVARMWTASGRLMATTEQVVWFNAKPAQAPTPGAS